MTSDCDCLGNQVTNIFIIMLLLEIFIMVMGMISDFNNANFTFFWKRLKEWLVIAKLFYKVLIERKNC